MDSPSSFSFFNLLFCFPLFCPTCFLSLMPPKILFSFLSILKPYRPAVCIYHPCPRLPQYLPFYAFGLCQHYSTRFNRFWPIYILLYIWSYIQGGNLKREERAICLRTDYEGKTLHFHSPIELENTFYLYYI